MSGPAVAQPELAQALSTGQTLVRLSFEQASGDPSVRTIALAALFVSVLGCVAVPVQSRLWIEALTDEVPWRRTAAGWERATWLPRDLPFRAPAMHPAMLAFLQVLLSVAALIAFPALLPRRSQAKTASSQHAAASHPTSGYRFRPGQWNKRPPPHQIPLSRSLRCL